MSKARIWHNTEAEYIGATGVNSIREMAELALADGDIAPVLCVYIDVTVERLENALKWHGVQPVIVPASLMRMEVWESWHMTPCAMDAKPGRGYVKVLGVSL